LFSKLDAVESVISRAAREIARVKNKLHPDKK